MTIREPHTMNRDFQHNNGFGPNVPLIEPEITVTAQFNKTDNPATLHTIVRISGVHGDSEFIYTNEENIGFIPEVGELFNIEALLNEVKNSVNRCFDDSHNACVRNSLAFPFANEHSTNLDLTQTRARLEQDLS